jgi:hypothetical protein
MFDWVSVESSLITWGTEIFEAAKHKKKQLRNIPKETKWAGDWNLHLPNII